MRYRATNGTVDPRVEQLHRRPHLALPDAELLGEAGQHALSAPAGAEVGPVRHREPACSTSDGDTTGEAAGGSGTATTSTPASLRCSGVIGAGAPVSGS